MSTQRTLLGFDYGKKRIGIAVGQELTRTASALTTLSNHHNDTTWQEIDTLIAQWKPGLLIVGLPVNMDDTLHELHDTVKSFGQALNQRYNIPVEWMDERLSSVEAEAELADHRKNRGNSPKKRQQNKSNIDKIAAEFILQSWLNQQG